jgi:hypothetical protein
MSSRPHPLRRDNVHDAVLRWLDEHPLTARLYVPVLVTLTLLVELVTGR